MLQKFRWWSVVTMPFLAFYLTGLVLETDALYLVKGFLLVCMYSALHFLSNLLFDDDLKNIFPLTVYLATKVILNLHICLFPFNPPYCHTVTISHSHTITPSHRVHLHYTYPYQH